MVKGKVWDISSNALVQNACAASGDGAWVCFDEGALREVDDVVQSLSIMVSGGERRVASLRHKRVLGSQSLP